MGGECGSMTAQTDQPPAHTKLIWAVLLSGPIAGCLVGTLIFAAIIISDWQHLDWFSFFLFGPMSFWMGLWLGILIGLPCVLLLGLSAHGLLRLLSRVSRWDYVAAGAACGIVPAALAQLYMVTNWNASLALLIFAAWISGPIAAYIFWLIRRPDRDEPPAHMPQPPAV